MKMLLLFTAVADVVPSPNCQLRQRSLAARKWKSEGEVLATAEVFKGKDMSKKKRSRVLTQKEVPEAGKPLGWFGRADAHQHSSESLTQKLQKVACPWAGCLCVRVFGVACSMEGNQDTQKKDKEEAKEKAMGNGALEWLQKLECNLGCAVFRTFEGRGATRVRAQE